MQPELDRSVASFISIWLKEADSVTNVLIDKEERLSLVEHMIEHLKSGLIGAAWCCSLDRERGF